MIRRARPPFASPRSQPVRSRRLLLLATVFALIALAAGFLSIAGR